MSDTFSATTAGPSLEVRIRRVLWVLLAGMLVVALGTVVSAWALAGAAGDVGRVEDASDALGGVLEGMVDQESAVRGFILTGREPFLEPYGPGGANADGELDRLDDLTTGLRGLDLDRLRTAIDDWREIADEELALVRAGDEDAAIAIVESGVPKERFDLIRTYTADIDDRLRRLIDTRNQRQNDLQRALASVGVAVAIGAGAVIVMTLRWLRRAVTRPLAELVGAVDRADDAALVALTDSAAGEVAAVARSTDRLRRVKDMERREAVVLAEQAERARVAADLHDGPVQTLFAVQLRLQGLAGRHPESAIGEVLDDSIDALEVTQGDLRSLMFDLAPPGLGERPIGDVLTTSVNELIDPPVTAEIDLPDDLALGRSAQVVVHRVVVEALRNVVRHAGATHVTLRVSPSDDDVTVEISDDGTGFDPAEAPPSGHFGLRIMRSLVESLDGTFTLDAVPGAGTTIRFTVPA